MRRRRALLRGLIATALIAVTAASVAFAAPNGPTAGQRIDLKVLLVAPAPTVVNGVNTEDAIFTVWKEQLDRLGVPYDTYVLGQSAPIADATLADYANNHSRYQGIILAFGDAALAQSEKDAIRKAEATFGIRQISDNSSLTNHGGGTALATGNAPAAGETAQLTAAGKAIFPYLKGPVAVAPNAFGFRGTPAAGNPSLLNAPDGSSYVSLWNRPDGTEELVNGLPGNNSQSHFQLLRDGMVNWLTRGVYLGLWRNYLGMDIDDVFLADNLWNPAEDITDFAGPTGKMTPDDVNTAVTWQNQTGIKLNMVYNGAGATTATDPLLVRFQQLKNNFRWINHTYSHPNLDCTTPGFTTAQIADNQAFFDANLAPGLAAGLNDREELVTGEHSGLANLNPGNPGTIDPPSFDLAGNAATGGLVPAGTWVYGLSATTAAGETQVSQSEPVVTTGATSRVDFTFEALCKASSYRLYRRASSATTWTPVTEVPQPAASAAFNDTTGFSTLPIADTGAAANFTGTASTTANTAKKAAYAQNPAFTGALSATGIKWIASDTSKPYPSPADKQTVSATDPTNVPALASFADGPAQALPRYPTNVYYNVIDRAAQLDEYNYVYFDGCTTDPSRTDCRTAPATWGQYIASEADIMMRHVLGNDPRPHYVHQTNIANANLALADDSTAGGGTLYALLNTVLRNYEVGIDRTQVPLAQVSQAEATRLLLRQQAWKAAKKNVTAYLLDDKVHITSPTTIDVPITGTIAGEDYAGNRSLWKTLQANADLVLDTKSPVQVSAAAADRATTPATEKSASTTTKKAKKSGKRPKLTQLRLSKRTFLTARKGRAVRRSSTRISWRLSRKATVRLIIQSGVTSKGVTTWTTRGTIRVKAPKGRKAYRFKGRLPRRGALGAGSYRVVATALAGGQNSAAKGVTFTLKRR